MKTLTIKQPWASLIVKGVKVVDEVYLKDIENRTWRTNFRGRVLIHAAEKPWTWQAFVKYLFENIPSIYELFPEKRSWLESLTMGAIIGSVEIVDCVINHPSIWAEKSETDCSEKCRSVNCGNFIEWGFRGNNSECRSCKLIGESYEIENVPKECPYNMKIKPIYNWVLRNPILFDKPIPAKGKLSFWEYSR
jgi:hypothetical protein